ncbi:MAG: pseudouridine synthase, RluA family [uncultured bacterium]|nr:MAG: pseudouridine synthase, RluA family [uncultured bacterium]
MSQVLNISGYKFVPVLELPELQAGLLLQANKLHLKGTILLSPEGLNLNLAGCPEDISAFCTFLKKDARFADMTFRESYSMTQPFRFMKVKLKKEIITFRQSDVRPEAEAATALAPEKFKQWLDEGRDITVLDTRNDYEVRFGTFQNAEHLHLTHFSEFSEASKKISRNKPIVMFCTGGIRCEKAALTMLQAGHTEVYQLEGGILNYFAKVGGDYFQGECFVFDQRIAVDASLQATGTIQCQECQGPITKEQSACSVCIHY